MTLRSLFSRFATQLPPAELIWIGIRPARKAELISLKSVNACSGRGLEGDHRCMKTAGSARQVTLISEEFIDQIALYARKDKISPALLRRNLVIRGLNLNALRYQQFQIGDAIFEASALCHPCSRMDQVLGEGGAAAMLGFGGLCCKVIQSGEIHIGDQLQLLYKS
ncbi:MOSC domain-containing protein [uncultured Neptuniibacter sp.]|uniref:MOSC domain-containing protein n=1 Tax=uncultured Neptuniibacter sp. TaxID=502143 RepID=UPI0026118F85|nr:MOSC domain-containing protein [uncultured Neptuniibacter sp.]